MTTLTKTARQEALTRVLKEAFEPKFSDLQKRLVQYTKDWLHTNHPVFEELLTRKDAREYLHTKHLPAVIPAESRAKLSALGIPASK